MSVVICDGCGSESAKEELIDQPIEMPDRVIFAKSVPVISCDICQISYTDHRGEEIRSQAIKACNTQDQTGR